MLANLVSPRCAKVSQWLPAKAGQRRYHKKRSISFRFHWSSEGNAEDADYSTLFEKVILAAKSAFKGTISANTESGFTLPPCEGGKENKITSDIPLRDCFNYDALQDKLIIPRILVNNFFHKVNPALSHNFTFGENTVDFATHWPSLVRVEADAHIPVHSCPLDTHMVLWNPSAISTAEVRVVHATDGNKFGVDMGNKDNSYLHYPRFRRSAFTGDQDAEHLGLPDKVNIASVILKKNEYLFVPNTMLASVSHHRSSLGDEALLLKSCMVDASNLNAFREAIVTPRICTRTNQLYPKKSTEPTSMSP